MDLRVEIKAMHQEMRAAQQKLAAQIPPADMESDAA